MNKKELNYTQLLDIEWELECRVAERKHKWDQVVKYGKDDLLYKLAYKDVKKARQALKDMARVIDVLRQNDLYGHIN